MKKCCYFLAVVFISQGCVANESYMLNEVAVVLDEKDKADKCVGPLLNVTSIDGDLDEASKKYAVGKSIKVASGTRVVWYSCELPKVVGERCFYTASLSKFEKIVEFSSGYEYLLFCNDASLLDYSRKKIKDN